MFIERFNAEFAPLLGARGPTFRRLFEELDKKAEWEFFNIVETGCLRVQGNWAGDGQSTFLFNEFLKTSTQYTSAWAVDISPDSVREAKVLCDRVTIVEGDATKFLADFGHTIDVLYLDSMDLDWANPGPSALNHLFELCAAQRWLGKGSLVMIDDTVRHESGEWLGKGSLVCQYFERTGAKLLASGYQALWEL